LKRPVVFVDRDGTLVEEMGYMARPDQVRLIPGAADAVRRLTDVGFAVVVVANQSGVARGLFTLADVEEVNHRVRELFAEEGAILAGIYYCPHLPTAHDSPFGGICICRKPYPGMAQEAARVLDLDLRHAFVVGDKLDDVGLANQLGVPGVLVRTGYGRDSEFLLGRHGAPKADFVVPNIVTAVDWILTRRGVGTKWSDTISNRPAMQSVSRR
jgi:D-glycero-D-manno-heptose 1,7-bisphosphate phosphatase